MNRNNKQSKSSFRKSIFFIEFLFYYSIYHLTSIGCIKIMALKLTYNSKLKDTIQSTNVFFLSEKVETASLKNFFNKEELEYLSFFIKKKEI